MEEERSVWNGDPSQALNLPAIILLALFFWLIFPLLSTVIQNSSVVVIENSPPLS